MSYLKNTLSFALALKVASGEFWKVNNLSLLGQGFVIWFFPLWEFYFLETNAIRKTLSLDETIKKYGTLYSGYRLQSFDTLTYPFFFLVRRVMFVFTATHTDYYSTF